ncbi:MAG TPA: S41 family peptidase [Rubricoccaceae bacterium]|nr:S41 family peptidase [Rubricoccaceae bacterium]
MLQRRTPLLALTAVLAVGILLGFKVRDVSSSTDEAEALRKLQEAFSLISRSYVERVDSARLVEDAIEGMLAGLDPHSVYISAREMRDVRETFDASFEGIGIYYEFIPGPADRDTLAVLMPIAGGPSEEAGLLPGDRIVQIDDTTALGFDTELVQRYLKGPRGTRVTVSVLRHGYSNPLEFTITRDRIPLETVVAAYMIDGQTGYVKLQRFARTSHTELLEAMRQLRAQGMQRMILDLRGNAGGLLEQAWRISDEFLPAGQMVVYTDSRHAGNNREYFATGGGAFETEPLIVLIDENAASASEIVAGALQDHDRALLVGRRTFGKGLVQQQFGLPDGSVLQMTVSRYYTPVGRLIQTPFELGAGEEEYFEAKQTLRDSLEQRFLAEGGLVDADRLGAHLPDSVKFRTDGGRTVYGGGGILPDYLVPLDTLSPALRTVIGKNLDSEFARTHLDRLGDRFRTEWAGRREAFMQSWTVDDATFRAFLAFAEERGVPVVDERPAEAEDEEEENVLVRAEAAEARDEIATRIKAYVARRLFGVEAFYPVIAPLDRTLTEATRLWSAASDLAAARPRR